MCRGEVIDSPGVAASPGWRKRGGFAGLPSSEGCRRSLPEFAVCARLGSGTSPSAAASATTAAFGAEHQRVKSNLHAPKRTVRAVRVTPEAAKANHRQGTAPAPGPAPWDGRTMTSTGRRAGPDG